MGTRGGMSKVVMMGRRMGGIRRGLRHLLTMSQDMEGYKDLSESEIYQMCL